jgi:hypothetical protein
VLAGRRIFGGQQHGAAPLAAQAQPLAKPTQRQKHRGQETDRAVGRQQTDQDGRDPHGQQRRHQRCLAPDPIAEVAEQRRPDRPREERQREGRERLQGRGGRIRLGKEQRREHQHGGCRVDVEIEELDGRADQTGEQNAPRRLHGGQ